MIHIHWFWLVIIISLSATFGFFLAAACAAAGRADAAMKALHESLPYPDALTADEALINYNYIANGSRIAAMRKQINKEGYHV